MKRVVVGQDHFLERVMVAILAQGHLLVEGVPGLAKTLTVKTLARTIRGTFERIQFTPDLVPADLVGTRTATTRRRGSSTRRSDRYSLTCCSPMKSIGAPAESPKRAARSHAGVSGDDRRRNAPRTAAVSGHGDRIPIETEGTYPLPEAQVDRFMMKILVGYPSEGEEFGGSSSG